jgi:hypothetical protein
MRKITMTLTGQICGYLWSGGKGWKSIEIDVSKAHHELKQQGKYTLSNLMKGLNKDGDFETSMVSSHSVIEIRIDRDQPNRRRTYSRYVRLGDVKSLNGLLWA